MSDTNLEELIKHSIRLYTAEMANEKEKADKELAEYEEELKKATREALAAIDRRDSIPVELIPYVKASNLPGYWDAEGGIRALREGYTPSEFRINAPGLAPVAFSLKSNWNTETRKDNPACVSSLVAHGGVERWETWSEAIALASRLHAEQEKWKREEAQRSEDAKNARLAAAPPSVSERIESLIREIAREEFNRIQTEDF